MSQVVSKAMPGRNALTDLILIGYGSYPYFLTGFALNWVDIDTDFRYFYPDSVTIGENGLPEGHLCSLDQYSKT